MLINESILADLADLLILKSGLIRTV